MLCGLSFLIYLGSDRRRVIGQPVMELDVQPLANIDRPFDLKQASGKVVLLHFWGPWCPPCRVEYPEIDKLAAKYADNKSVCIVSISCSADTPDAMDELKRDTLAMFGGDSNPHPIYYDPAAFSRVQIAKLLGQRGFAYPTSVLLDRQGRIEDYWVGATAPGELERAIRSAVGRATVAAR
jgi:thiol-disulfide isomerase/thioredoxin